METFLLRAAAPADAARLAEFGARTFRETFEEDNTAEDMDRHLAASFSPEIQLCEIQDANVDTLVVTDTGGQWLGFAQLRTGQPAGIDAPGSIELWRFYVDRPWQGRGVASALMAAAKARARERGARGMWLGVWERNARAQAFYRKQGFERVGSKVFVVGSDAQTDDVFLCTLA